MTLKELQQMIKEEFDAYMGEAEDDVDVTVDAGDVDAEAGDKDAEDMLRKIYDMLKDKFDAEDMGDEEMTDVEADEDMNEEADLEEAASTGFGDPGAKNTSGKDAGYTPAKTTKGDGKLHESVARFQKLANIIK